MSNMVVQTNVLALNSHRNMKTVGANMSKASARLSSGYRINSAADDAAGLAISEKMRAQIRGLDMASKNAQDGISLIQTAEGGMQEIDNMVQRIRELTVQAKNSTNTSEDTDAIQKEVDQLIEEIDAMASRVQFNGMNLIGKGGSGFSFRVGANKGQVTAGNISAVDAKTLLIDKFDVVTNDTDDLDAALKTVSDARAQLGAYQNRLEYTVKSLDISSENLSDAESRIRNTDMAKEMMNFTKANVLQQASVSMLAQANQAPQSVLQLLR